ncbi:MAG: hypothetical protein ACYC2P_03240 [Paludibacteraceae bacterium]
MNKEKVFIWIIVLLVLLNLTTIGTIIYHNYQDEKVPENAVVTGSGQNPLNGRFFKQDLGFDEEQMAVFRIANRDFRSKSNGIIFKLDSLKHLMFDEMNDKTVDLIKIDQLSKEIGTLHTELKQETNRFYLRLKKVSDAEQSEKLKDTFAPLFYQDGVNDLQKGHGQGRRHGWNQQHQNANQSNDSINK